MNKELHLPLKRKWYDMIRSGEKTEEYREITPYWAKRICGCPANIDWCHEKGAKCTGCSVLRRLKPKKNTSVHFTLGYPKRDDAARHMVKRINEIVIGTGKPEWGAEPGVEYFVIKLNDECV